MAVIKNLDILLGARTEGLDKGLRNGVGMISGFTRRVEGMGGGAALAGGFNVAASAAMRAVPAVAALTVGYLGLKNSVDSFNAAAARIDTQAKVSDRLGVDLQAFQAMSYAVRTSSAATEQDMVLALQTMQKNSSMAAAGFGDAVRAFNTLNISAAEFNALTPDQKMMQLAQAMQGVANQGDRVRIVQQIMGEGGAKMLNTLQNGPAAISAAMQEAQTMGMTLTRSQASQVEQMNDQWTRLGDYVNAIWNQIAAAAAPTLTAIIDMFLDNTSSAASFGDTALWVFDMVNSLIAATINIVAVLDGAWKLLTATISGVIALIAEIPARVEDAVNAAREIAGLAEIDFGFRGTADSMQASAMEQFREAGRRLEDGFTGRASQGFLDRIEAIRKTAADAEAAANARAQVQPEELPNPSNATQLAGPKAASQGSAEAASIINQIRRESPEKAIRETAAKQEAALKRLEAIQTQQLNTLRSGNGVLIPAGG